MTKEANKKTKAAEGMPPVNDKAAARAETITGEGGGSPTEPAAESSFRKKRAAEVFATHTVDELYFTDDDQCFVNQQFAVLHAQGLKSQTVTPVQRKEIE